MVGDTSRLPFRDNSFSTAFDFGCLNCHSLQAIPAYVRELARVMRPGGQFLLRSRHPDQDGPEPKPADAPHRYTLEQLRGFLEPTIALEEVGEAYEPVLAPHRRRRYVTWWRVQSAP